MTLQPEVVDGSFIYSSGTAAGDANILLPEPLYGKLDRIFIRYYFRLGAPYLAKQEYRKLAFYDKNHTVAQWITNAGKFGIVADHSTSYGGYSGSSGGGNGWQMRSSWYDSDAGTGGPDEGGWAVGNHMYDFCYQNPKGYNYGCQDPIPAGTEKWGQGGLQTMNLARRCSIWLAIVLLGMMPVPEQQFCHGRSGIFSLRVRRSAATFGPGAGLAFGAICVMSGAATGADMVILPALFSRTVLVQGVPSGIAFGVWSFAQKISLALAAALVLPVLQASGFTAGAKNTVQALHVLTLTYAVLPCFLKLLALVLVARLRLDAEPATLPVR